MKYKVEGIGTPPSFKNGKVIIFRNNKPFPITRPDRQKWMKKCVKQLSVQRVNASIKPASKAPKRVKVGKWESDDQHIKIRVVREWGRLADLDGMVSTIMDCLVKANIIADDSPRYVRSINSDWENGKSNRIEIDIWKDQQL